MRCARSSKRTIRSTCAICNGRMRPAEISGWWRMLLREGWIAPNWPREWGGMGLDAGKMVAYLEEMERFGVGRAPDQGITQVGPIVIKFGTQAQKGVSPRHVIGRDHLVPGLFGAERGVRSRQSSDRRGPRRRTLRRERPENLDLARARCDAHLSARTHRPGSQEAERHQLPARGPEDPRHHDPADPHIAGHEEFCQVFFDNVRVPLDALVGKLNEGWTIAKALLGFERLNIGSPRRPYALLRLEMLARAKGLLGRCRFPRSLHGAEARSRRPRVALFTLRGTGEARRAARAGRVVAQDLGMERGSGSRTFWSRRVRRTA